MAKVKVLEEIEHIRLRSGMYIGEGDTPLHLATEVLDNALDELVNGYTRRIAVYIHEDDKQIAVFDWGRGIPIHEVKLPDGSKTDSIIAIATKLFSSTKFDNKAYDISIGQNGVGLVVVNALSEYLTIITKHPKNEDQRIKYHFVNGQFVSRKVINVDMHYPSTLVEFKPDMKYFKEWLDENIIINRLKLVKAHFPNSIITFNNKHIENITYEDFVRETLNISKDLPLYTLEVKDGKQKAKLTFTYDMSDNAKLPPVVKGDVNLKLADGSYISTIQTVIANSAYSTIPKSYVMRKEDALLRLRAYISILVPQPKFDSQNKTRFVGDVRKLLKLFEPKLTKLFKTESFLKEVLEKQNEYRILKSISKKNNKVNKKVKTSTGNPVKMSKKKGTLYIVEGLSAAGTLTQIRDVNYEAVFPLKGKIINVETNTLDKVLNNKEFKYLMEVLGIQLGKDYDLEWDKIVIMPDADADGNHIAFLMLVLLYKFAKKYFEDGRVYLIIPPLYAYKKNGKLVLHPGLTPPDVDNFIRYKGLGEMNPEELGQVIRDNRFYIQLTPSNFEEIISITKNSELKRKLINDESIPIPFSLLEV